MKRHFTSFSVFVYSMSLLWLQAIPACRPLPVYHDGKTGMTRNSGIAERGKISREQQSALLAEVELWKGTPYRFGMAERGKGTDCSGFVGHVYRIIFKMELPRQANEMVTKGRPIAKNDLRFGDLVFFKNTYKAAKGASHVGVYIGNNRMAHASTNEGVTISDLSEKYYQKHYSESRRVLP